MNQIMSDFILYYYYSIKQSLKEWWSKAVEGWKTYTKREGKNKHT